LSNRHSCKPSGNISRGARARDGIDVLLLNSNTNRSWAAIPTLGKNVIIQRVRTTHYSWAYGPDSMCFATKAQETLRSNTKATGAGGETRWNIQKPKVIFLLENSPFIYCSSPSSRTLYFLCCSLILYCSPHSSYRLLTEDQRIRYRWRAGREPSRRMRHVAVGRATG